MLLALALCLPTVQSAPAEHLVRVLGDVPERVLLDVGLSEHHPNWLADDGELEELARRGVRHEVLREDVAAWYRSRLEPLPVKAGALGGWLSPPYGGGAMGGYYTYAEVVSVLDQLTAAYPAIVAPKVSIGPSLEVRELWMLEVSDNPGVDEGEPEVRFDSLTHGREAMSLHAPLWFLLWLLDGYGADPLATFLVDERRLFFVPVVNLDGYVYNEQQDPCGGGLWRKNRRDNWDGTFGVDLNRNYDFQWGFDDEGSSPNTWWETYRGPFAASEPETQAMQAFLAARDFDVAMTTHTFSDVVLRAWGYTFTLPPQESTWTHLDAALTAENGLPAGPGSSVLYIANGSTLDYDFGVHGTYSWTPELGDASEGFWPPTAAMVPLAEEHRPMYAAAMRVAGAAVVFEGVALTDLGDGDGFLEAGETFRVDATLRNAGLATTATSVVVDLAVPGATVSGSPQDLGALASGTTVVVSPTFTVPPGAAGGDALGWTLTATTEGLPWSESGSAVVGTPRAVVRDELEADLGWTAGVPGDDASSGQWERGNPIGTSSQGQPASPEDDFTTGGTQCFVTGNGGGSAGNDDVDDGRVTLVSPPVDLSGVSFATLSYARWFADLTQADDVLDVSLSSDGGQTWHVAELLAGNHNAWEVASVVVGDVVPLTDDVRLRVIAEDDPNNSVVEAAIDDLVVEVWEEAPRLVRYGTPEVGTPISLSVTGEAGAPWSMYGAFGGASIPLPGVGLLELDPATLFPVAGGALGVDGVATLVAPLPANPGTIGSTVHLQAGVVAGGVELTNAVVFTLE